MDSLPPCPVRYNSLDDATLADPHPVLAELRLQAPAVWHGTERRLVTRYADSVRVLRDHELLARDPRQLGSVVPTAHLSVQGLDRSHQAAARSTFMTAPHHQDLPAH
ncbi:hypothetical protein [Streptomyces sp. NBC_00996]|uniref:hypothetical protein n=1 Tax=Streptomyces sp. NBC_00996 TaxID=2903710 RepID=UPI00386C1678|nr:hypothetical protein OG390_02975 [Streptomyces sp. NBC_00996]